MATGVTFWLSYGLLWVVMLLVIILLAALTRQVGLIHRRIGPWGARVTPVGPAIGTYPPQFTLTDVRGRDIRIGGVRERPLLVVSSSASCKTCRQLVPSLRSLFRSDRTRLDIVVASMDPPAQARDFAEEHFPAGIPVVADEELIREYGLTSSPYGVIIDSSGAVRAKGMVNSLEHLESLVVALEVSSDSAETHAENIMLVQGVPEPQFVDPRDESQLAPLSDRGQSSDA